MINGTESDSVSLSTGFPQGGGAGPWCYTKYTQPVSQIIALLQILYHFFADDSQLYKSFLTSSQQSQLNAKASLEECIHAVSKWMFSNRLKLNMDKTELIIFGTKQQLSKVIFNEISVCNENIPSVSAVRNLSVFLDQHLKMIEHVSHVVKTAYWHIRKLRSIRRYLTVDTMKTLVHCFILSRLDYCNSLLFGISEESLDRLQRMQNAVARLIYGLRKRDHVTEALKIALASSPCPNRI